MNYTNKQLIQALAKMLPEQIFLRETHEGDCYLLWRGKYSNPHDMEVRETELLHLCWLVEDNLTKKEYGAYSDATYDLHLEIVSKTKKWIWLSMPWQQRVVALAKVKGIEI